MRLTKAMKEAIVEDYARHMYFQRLTQIGVEITKDLTDLTKKELKTNMDFYKKVNINELAKFTEVNTSEHIYFKAFSYAKDIKNNYKSILSLLLMYTSDDKNKGLYIPTSSNITNRLKIFNSNKSSYTFFFALPIKLPSSILVPKTNPISLLTKDFDNPKFKKILGKIYSFSKEIDEAYIHINQVSQLVHSVTTDNKLLELIPDMQQFIPNSQQCTTLVPIDTINQIKKNLSK